MLIPQELQLSPYIPILHPDIYCSNWLLVIPATLINSILFAYSNL